MTAKKILHMHFGKDGGAERFFVNLVQAFGEAGMEQRFVTRPGRIWRDEIAPLGPIIENHYRRISPTSLWLTWRSASHGAGVAARRDHGMDVAILAPDPGLAGSGEADAAGGLSAPFTALSAQ